MCRLAALLILRRVGILSTVFLSVYVSSVGRPTLAPNVLRLYAVVCRLCAVEKLRIGAVELNLR